MRGSRSTPPSGSRARTAGDVARPRRRDAGSFGLVTPGGVVGSTGSPDTFGGGIGHLTTQYGLTCDNLVGGRLVTPEGSVVRAA
jgi:hypothetical protein